MDKLADTYEKLLEAGKDFEVILIGTDDEEYDFEQRMVDTPWPHIPYQDRHRIKMIRILEVDGKHINQMPPKIV